MTLGAIDRLGLFLRALGTLPSNHVLVPDVPSQDGRCWRQGPTLWRCTKARFHAGPCTWDRPVAQP